MSVNPNNTKKILCVICKVHLQNIDNHIWRCPRCRREYFLHSEIMEHEDEGLDTVHESEAATIELAGLDANSGSGLEVLDNEAYFHTMIDDIEHNPGRITIPWYMKGPNVEYEEELPEENN